MKYPLIVCAALVAALDGAAKPSLDYVDPLIGTEGSGSQYGGMMPYTCVPFGSFHLVPMTRVNRVGQLSFNQADKTLLGFILTRQPAIWMGDWGETRIPIEPAEIESFDPAPYRGRITAGGRSFEYTATMHAAWIRGDLNEIRLVIVDFKGCFAESLFKPGLIFSYLALDGVNGAVK
jgi:hypothetical protein